MPATAKEIRKWKKALKDMSRRELIEYGLRTRVALEYSCIMLANAQLPGLPGHFEVEAEECLDRLEYKAQNWEIGTDD